MPHLHMTQQQAGGSSQFTVCISATCSGTQHLAKNLKHVLTTASQLPNWKPSQRDGHKVKAWFPSWLWLWFRIYSSVGCLSRLCAAYDYKFQNSAISIWSLTYPRCVECKLKNHRMALADNNVWWRRRRAGIWLPEAFCCRPQTNIETGALRLLTVGWDRGRLGLFWHAGAYTVLALLPLLLQVLLLFEEALPKVAC